MDMEQRQRQAAVSPQTKLANSGSEFAYAAIFYTHCRFYD